MYSSSSAFSSSSSSFSTSSTSDSIGSCCRCWPLRVVLTIATLITLIKCSDTDDDLVLKISPRGNVVLRPLGGFVVFTCSLSPRPPSPPPTPPPSSYISSLPSSSTWHLHSIPLSSLPPDAATTPANVPHSITNWTAATDDVIDDARTRSPVSISRHYETSRDVGYSNETSRETIITKSEELSIISDGSKERSGKNKDGVGDATIRTSGGQDDSNDSAIRTSENKYDVDGVNNRTSGFIRTSGNEDDEEDINNRTSGLIRTSGNKVGGTNSAMRTSENKADAHGSAIRTSADIVPDSDLTSKKHRRDVQSVDRDKTLALTSQGVGSSHGGAGEGEGEARGARRRGRRKSTIYWLDKDGFDIQPYSEQNSLVYAEDVSADDDGDEDDDDDDDVTVKKLYIVHIANHHAGLYTCVERFPHQHNVLQSAAIKLLLYKEIQIEEMETTTVVGAYPGETVLLPCRVTGLPVPTVSWRFTGNSSVTNSPLSDGRAFQTTAGLQVFDVTTDDVGLYSCRAEVEATGHYKEKKIQLILKSVPVFSADIGVKYGTKGELLTVNCTVVSGYPPPKYSITRVDRNGVPVLNNDDVTSPEGRMPDINCDTGLITFQRVLLVDEGHYVCAATNEAGQSFARLTLKVHRGPEISEFKSVTEVKDMTATLLCISQGNPTPNITFSRLVTSKTTTTTHDYEYNTGYVLSKPNEISDQSHHDVTGLSQHDIARNYSDGINDGGRVVVSTVHDGCATLYIRDLRSDDAGEYLCRTKNKYGADERIASIVVVYEPMIVDRKPNPIYLFPGQRRNLTCHIDGAPTPTIQWRHLNHTLTNNETFRIQSTDDGSVLQLTMRGSRQSAANPVGAKDVGPFLEDAPEDTWMHGVYTCVARNPYGSVHLDIEVRGMKVPSAPRRVVVVDRMTSYVELSVTPSLEFDGGLPLRGYQVQYDDVSLFFARGKRLRIDTLRPGTTYVFHLRGVNELGPGRETQLVLTTNNLDRPSQIVVTSRDVSESSTSYLVTWSAPDDGGSPIRRYEIKYRRVKYTSLGQIVSLEKWRVDNWRTNLSGSNQEGKVVFEVKHRLERLQPGSYYQLQARAENDFDWSPQSETFIFTTASSSGQDDALAVIASSDASRHVTDRCHDTFLLTSIFLLLVYYHVTLT